MDNITHSLIGFALGHVAPVKKTSRQKAVATAVIASNIPDLDFLLGPLMGQSENLDYLLHHRGYTHTFLLSIPLGIFSTLIATKFRSLKLDLLCLGVFCVLFHIGFDFLNNYGTHPFSPFYNRWFYGDTLFILEPSIWLTLMPFAFFKAKSKFTQRLVIGLMALLLAVVWTLKFTPLMVAGGLTLVALAATMIQKAKPSAITALGALLSIVTVFGAGSSQAKKIFEKSALALKPEFRIRQISAHPLPGNPFCWNGIVAGFAGPGDSNEENYLTRLGWLSLIPQWIPSERCIFRESSNSSRLIPVTLTEATSKDSVFWVNEFQRPLRELRHLSEENCRFNAFLRFARIPIWNIQSQPWLVGDLRFDHEKGRGFSKIEISPGNLCPKKIPPWVPPLGLI